MHVQQYTVGELVRRQYQRSLEFTCCAVAIAAFISDVRAQASLIAASGRATSMSFFLCVTEAQFRTGLR